MKSLKLLTGLAVLLAIVIVAQSASFGQVHAQNATQAATMAATTAASGGSSFVPTNLRKIVDDLTTATKGKVDDPSKVRLAIVVNVLSPFWTAAAIGEQRASSELGAPVVFEAPDQNNSIASPQSILESPVTDQYSGVAFSAVDPASVVNVVKKGMAGKINFVLMDSDSPNNGRPLYICLNNYNCNVLASKSILITP